ncbi:MAG: hypothetical protein K9J74_04375 [Sulfuritalea sp.]|nr:hypothetical protein [Sulfuritalea sp.]
MTRNPAGFRSPVLESGFATTRSGNQGMQSRRNDKLTFIADQENCFNDSLEFQQMLIYYFDCEMSVSGMTNTLFEPILLAAWQGIFEQNCATENQCIRLLF